MSLPATGRSAQGGALAREREAHQEVLPKGSHTWGHHFFSVIDPASGGQSRLDMAPQEP